MIDISTSSAAISFLAAIGLKEPAKQMGFLLSEQIQSWRHANLVAILSKSIEICKKNGIKLKELPNGFTIPFLEAAQHQDNNDIQDIWASLFSNMILGESIHPSYINILKDLTGFEIRILFVFYKLYLKSNNQCIGREDYFSIVENEISASYENPSNLNPSILISNLQRLNLVRFIASKDKTARAEMTSFAIDFVKACSTNTKE